MSHPRIKIGQIGIGHNHGADKMIALRFCVDEAGYITGQNYVIDGGRSIGLKGGL